VRIVKNHYLDTFGCAFGGYTAGPSQIAVKLARDGSARQARQSCAAASKRARSSGFRQGVMSVIWISMTLSSALTHAGASSDTIAALLQQPS